MDQATAAGRNSDPTKPIPTPTRTIPSQASVMIGSKDHDAWTWWSRWDRDAKFLPFAQWKLEWRKYSPNVQRNAPRRNEPAMVRTTVTTAMGSLYRNENVIHTFCFVKI